MCTNIMIATLQRRPTAKKKGPHAEMGFTIDVSANMEFGQKKMMTSITLKRRLRSLFRLKKTN